MNRFEQLLTQGADFGSVEAQLLTLAALLVLGAVAHLVLGFFFRRLHRIARLSEQRWDDVIITALERPLRLLLWLVVLSLALEVQRMVPLLAKAPEQVYYTGMVLLFAWFLHRLIAGVEQELLEHKRDLTASTDKATVRATSKLARITLWMIAALMVLQTLGVSVSGLLAFGGIGGIAVGFAAKDLLANFFGSLSIYLDRPFTIGDWIRSPDKQIEGTVEDIGWRLTRIRTFDQRPLYVPNATFSQISVENPSRMFNRRIYETIGIRYQDAAAMAAIVEQVRTMLEQHPDIDLERTLIVNFVSFGPSSLDFFIYTFTRTTNWVEFHKVKQDVLLKVLAIIHDNNADVAFPTRTLHVEQTAPEPSP